MIATQGWKKVDTFFRSRTLLCWVIFIIYCFIYLGRSLDCYMLCLQNGGWFYYFNYPFVQLLTLFIHSIIDLWILFFGFSYFIICIF